MREQDLTKINGNWKGELEMLEINCTNLVFGERGKN